MKKMMFNDRYGLTEAVIEKRKNLTRRLVKIDFGFEVLRNHVSHLIVKNSTTLVKAKIFPPYQVGEIVAVAQSYQDLTRDKVESSEQLTYHKQHKAAWTNKMFVKADLMPHQIRILNVRAERLQDITEEDCVKEGIHYDVGDINDYQSEEFFDFYRNPDDGFYTPHEAFASLIDKISGKGTWERNPFVWRIEFELIK